jgi:formylglycine-generating enzyme required for sulfatase activity
MIVVPAGNFLMGSPANDVEGIDDERPQHEVRIGKPIAVGRYEVTFDEWEACFDSGDCKDRHDNGWGRGKRPVVNVSWDDAQAYIGWLSKKTGHRYRLLSEAEWEYAARAGTTTRYPWGDEPGSNLANFKDSGSPWGGAQTAPVGSFEPNKFGLHDMVGNVWEWVQDCSNSRYSGAPTDGSAREEGDCGVRMRRGGGFGADAVGVRAATRGRFEKHLTYKGLGFRVVRDL